VPRLLHSSAAAASVSKRVRRSSKQTDMGIIGSGFRSEACLDFIHSDILARCLFF